MLSSVLLAVHPSVILSVKDPGEIRCRIDSKKFFLYSKLKVNSFNSTATARLLICVVQQVSLIKPVYSFLDFKMRVFKIPLLKERLQCGERTLEEQSDDLVLILVLPLASCVALEIPLDFSRFHFSHMSTGNYCFTCSVRF